MNRAIAIRPWLWVPRSEAQVEGEWQLEAVWHDDAGQMWSTAISQFGSENDEPNESMTEHLAGVLRSAVLHEWWIT